MELLKGERAHILRNQEVLVWPEKGQVDWWIAKSNLVS
jgi:hypothetical protein